MQAQPKAKYIIQMRIYYLRFVSLNTYYSCSPHILQKSLNMSITLFHRFDLYIDVKHFYFCCGCKFFLSMSTINKPHFLSSKLNFFYLILLRQIKKYKFSRNLFVKNNCPYNLSCKKIYTKTHLGS